MTKEQFIEITEWFRQVDGRIHPADHLDELYNLLKDLKDFVILPDYPHQTEMKRAVFGASFIAMFRIADACGFTYEEIMGLISERHRKNKNEKIITPFGSMTREEHRKTTGGHGNIIFEEDINTTAKKIDELLEEEAQRHSRPDRTKLIKTFNLFHRNELTPEENLSEWVTEINGNETRDPEILKSLMKSGYFFNECDAREFVAHSRFANLYPQLY